MVPNPESDSEESTGGTRTAGSAADADRHVSVETDGETADRREVVLVVDDEPGAADLAATYLERLLDEVETVTVTSPAAALERLRERRIDCVVSDHDMPESTGLELLETVRSEVGDVPFVLFTGKGSEEIASEAISAGVTDYLQKEGGTDQYEMLANRVDNALSRRQAESDLREVNRKVTAIHEFATGLSCVDSVEGVFERVVDVASEVLEFDRCLTARREGEYVYPAALSEGVTEDDVRRFELGEGLAGRTVAEERTFLVEEVGKSADADPVDDDVESAISVPIGGYGLIQAISSGRATFDKRDVEFAELVAAHAAEAMEQIETEGALRAERDRLAALFDNVPSPVARLAIDESGERRLDATNDAFESTFGCAAGEVTYAEMCAAIVPEGVESIEPDWSETDMGPIRTEVERRTVSGVRDFILNAIPTERDDEVLLHLVYADIDEQKRVERTLRRLHEATREMFRGEDRQTVAEVAARTAIDTLGFPNSGVRLYDPQSGTLEPTAISEEAIAAIGDRPPFGPGDGLVWDAYDRNEVVVVDDLASAETVVEYGDVRSLLVVPLGDHGVMPLGSPDPHFFDDTDVRLAQVLAANVTAALDRAERTEQLRERDAALQRELDRLEKFAGVVSHDLRNPLTVATGRVELLRALIDGEDAHEQLDRVEDAHARMGELIDDLLALAREGRTVDDPEPVALADAVREAWGTVDTDGAALEVETGNAIVHADPERLRTLFENLFRNSVEHGSTSSRVKPGDSVEHGSTGSRIPPESGDGVEHGSTNGDHGVTVTVETLPDGFSVADDGPGFDGVDPEEAMEYGVSSADQGSGLGLAIVREIADAHGWRVSVGGREAGTGGADGDAAGDGDEEAAGDGDGARFEFRTDG
ncbi:Histidine kinase-, DNA gyrase B-, and HSP90-like ATPase [Halorubrum aquaticum]|uniref:histidine kinase n=1 Tax=Halorubrum aquaticum TaxID=387340 RepID=A0A1I3BLU3_9EURY|nr:GAF domain-containing protein [Halorubrum aquaticum]SFH63213.1 Histidine kinase-, DNA gyrase B-, and HSP90-like ATPase [Halorubrum aquaticum]